MTTHGYLPTDNVGKVYCWPCWAALGNKQPALHGHTDNEQCDCCGSVIPPDTTPVYKATQPQP